MKLCADRVPEAVLTTVDAWDAIIKEILQNLKPYLDVEADVHIE